jgi:hypothetical protein
MNHGAKPLYNKLSPSCITMCNTSLNEYFMDDEFYEWTSYKPFGSNFILSPRITIIYVDKKFYNFMSIDQLKRNQAQMN